MAMDIKALIREAVDGYTYRGEYVRHEPLGNGHINDTFLVVCNNGERDYL